MVKDKINHRARGPRTLLTRQTVQGRANDGGLRIGEMERDGITGHGAAFFLNESMMIRGDEYYMAVCNKSGMTAIYNESMNLFLSPQADGPIKFVGTLDNGMNIENVTKYGRSFSVIRIPYAFKLLMQELQTMNVQMRIITEDNIDQMTNLAFSDNIIKLAGKDATPQTVLTKARQVANSLNQPNIQKRSPFVQPETPEVNPFVGEDTYVPGDFNQMPFMGKSPEVQGLAPESPEYLYSPTQQPRTPEQPPTKLSPEQLGWLFDRYGYEEGDVFKSAIIGSDGRATQFWYVDDNDYQEPNIFPSGWIESDLVRNNGEPIQVWEVVMGLRTDQQPGNWKRVIDRLKSSPVSPQYNPNNSPGYVPVSPDYPVDKPQSSPGYVPVSPDYPFDQPPSNQEYKTPPSVPDYAKGVSPFDEQKTGGSGMRQLQPTDITPPNINININVPQIGGDEDKKKKEDPEKEKVDEITNAIEEIKEKNITTTIIKPSSGVGECTLAVEESDSESNTSDNTSKSGGEKKKVTFGGF